MKRPPGRPPLPPGERKTAVYFTLSARDLSRLDALRQDMPRSAMIRALILAAFQRLK